MIKKGFTLIELLAVIVILAIILLISTSIIFNLIDNARKGAFKNTAYGIVKTTETEIIKNVLIGKDTSVTFTYKDGVESSLPEGYKLNYKGTKPQSGKVIINSKGKIGMFIYNGSWCAIKEFDVAEITLLDLSEAECLQSVMLATITLIGSPVEYVEINTSYTDAGAFAQNIDGDILSDIHTEIKYNNTIVENVDVSKLGTYEITYGVQYEGYKANTKRTVIVQDTIPPELTIPSNITLKVEEVPAYDFMNGVIVSDNSLEDIEVTMSGNVSALPGEYTITYKSKDSSGNETSKTRYVTVIDVGYPEITILGDNPTNINVGSAYTDAGATAIDDVDGNITSRIVTTGTVNINVVGTYTITYTVSDNANNKTSVTRTVNVIDNVPPTVTYGTNGNSAYANTRSTTVIVSDAHSSINTSSLKYLWNTSTTKPSEGSFTISFTNRGTISSLTGASGGYYLWILAKDTVGNTTIQRSNIFNLDNAGPVVSSVISGTSNITSSSFTITRSGNATDAHSGLATNPYIYQISTNGSSWTTKCTNNTTSCAVTGLSATTNYYYRICVNDLLDNQSCVASKTIATIEPHYYYDRYTSVSETYYELERTFSAGGTWSDDECCDYSVSGYTGYTFNSITGKFSSTGVRKSIPSSTELLTVYSVWENYVIEYKQNSYPSTSKGVERHSRTHTKISPVAMTRYRRGTINQADIIGLGNLYPADGRHTDGYWYVRKGIAY